jgi:hypothetical protein
MIGEIPISDACHYMDAHETETLPYSVIGNCRAGGDIFTALIPM